MPGKNEPLVHHLATVICFILAVVVCVMAIGNIQKGSAEILLSRSVRVSSSRPGESTTHNFKFDIASTGQLGSLEFEYCVNDPIVGAPCVAPTGLNVLGAAVNNQTGQTGFARHPNSTANKLILTRAPVAATPGTSTYAIGNIVNPTTGATTVYVRVSTFSSVDASGPRVDSGTVVFSTSGGLGASGFVPPFLTFCVGVAVAPDCSSTSGNSLSLGELSSSRPKTASSQFAGATNDVNGYNVNLFGTTMTSGNNVINPMTVPGASSPGSSQFGLNLRANTTPAVGQNPLGAGTATPAADYNTPNRFAFHDGMLASSPLSTEFNTITVSYMVNVPTGQPAGIYSTTATFIAVVSF